MICRWLLAVALIGLPGVAHAQLAIVPPRVDTTTLATKAEVQAAQATASAAQTAAAAACVATPSVPNMEMVGGAAGSNTGQCRPVNSVQPRISRAGTTVTGQDGTWSITWTTPLDQVPVVLPIPIDGGAQPVMCTVATRATTGATGRCFRSQLLPSTITLVSSLAAFNVLGGLASGVSVQLVAIPPTQ